MLENLYIFGPCATERFFVWWVLRVAAGQLLCVTIGDSHRSARLLRADKCSDQAAYSSAFCTSFSTAQYCRSLQNLGTCDRAQIVNCQLAVQVVQGLNVQFSIFR